MQTICSVLCLKTLCMQNFIHTLRLCVLWLGVVIAVVVVVVVDVVVTGR